jgi:nucleotidyltransferase/DNA polymerase involved in DNA repair
LIPASRLQYRTKDELVNGRKPVQWLFLDLNAFFASCEQQENPALRGQPVIVVQTLTESAVAIAASYAAKAFGIKTGTPNVFLGKVGSDLQKPNGLVVITKDDLPGILLGLQLQDIYGIGKRMEQRLHRTGIVNVEQLWKATPHQLRRVWGGVNGLLFHQMLHGVDIQPPTSRYSKSIGHQHVLEPDLRTKKGAHDFAQHLLTKAAERLRRGDYYCRRLGVHLSWVGDLGGWWDETDFHETRDTGFLLGRLEEL